MARPSRQNPSKVPHPKFRKRRGKSSPPRDELSTKLRQIRDTLQRGEIEAGLSQLDELLLKRQLSSDQQGALLSLAADSEFDRGAYEEAAGLYEQAAALSASHSEMWARPLLGQVRAEMKAGMVEKSVDTAHRVLETAKTKWADFHNGAVVANQRLVKGRKLVVMPRPQRISVIAADLGRFLLREGETEAAKFFLNEAIQACPKGATRARESLAELALREERFDEALQWAMQALMTGRLQAKTLPTLGLIVRINARRGYLSVGQEVLAIVQTAIPSVRARATQMLVQELRAVGSNQWRSIAQTWLQRWERQYPVVAAEFKKLFLREAKQLASDPETNLSAASRLLQQPGISPSEWTSAAKELVRSSWLSGKDPGLDELLQQADALFGESFALDAAQSLFISTMMGMRHDVAVPWMEQRLQQMDAKTDAWGRAIWTLGKAKHYLGQPLESAKLYDSYARNLAMPVNLRVQARTKWINLLINSGDESAVAAGLPEIRQVLPEIDDWSLLLDIARQVRQVRLGDPSRLSREVFEKAQILAIQAANQAATPAEAHTILLKLARRTTQDFFEPARTVALWHRIPEDRKLWLWSENSAFWEYLSFVLLSMFEAGQLAEAQQFYQSFISDAGTPRHGKLYLHVTAGDWLMENGKERTFALAALKEAIKLDPKHHLTKPAHYWWAQFHWANGDRNAAKEHAIHVRLAPWNISGQYDERKRAAKAELILADGDPSKIDPKIAARFGKGLSSLLKAE